VNCPGGERCRDLRDDCEDSEPAPSYNAAERKTQSKFYSWRRGRAVTTWRAEVDDFLQPARRILLEGSPDGFLKPVLSFSEVFSDIREILFRL
jgi:hypothetical protein